MMMQTIIQPVDQRLVDGKYPITDLGDNSLLSTERQSLRDFTKLAHEQRPLNATFVAHLAVFEHHGFRVEVEEKDGIDRELKAGTQFEIPAGRGLKLNALGSERVAEGVDFGSFTRVFLLAHLELILAGNG